MDLLEHPLEAVAFRLYSLPIPDASAATAAAAAWTCLAAVLAAAAAAGLWRLRSSPSSTPANPLALQAPSRAAPEVSAPEPSTRPPSQRSTEPAAAAAAMTAVPAPKETYTAYYRDAGCVVGCCADDEEDEEDRDDVEEHEDGDHGDVFVQADPFRWEVVRSLPLSPTTTAAAEMGRYRYRRIPAAALISGGGSVVQLWDQRRAGGGGLMTASPRRRGRGVLSTVSAF